VNILFSLTAISAVDFNWVNIQNIDISTSFPTKIFHEAILEDNVIRLWSKSFPVTQTFSSFS
jgi:hypothetical protein